MKEPGPMELALLYLVLQRALIPQRIVAFPSPPGYDSFYGGLYLLSLLYLFASAQVTLV